MSSINQYKYMEEEFIGPALLCVICKRPFKDPRYTPCNHIVCCECISGRMETNWDPCPTCGKLLLVDSQFSIRHSPVNIFYKIRVKCTLCGQTELQRENFDDHINRECPNVHVSCPSTYIKCPWIGQRNQLNNHLSTCIFQSFSSRFSELFVENRQVKEQCQKQMSYIQQLQTELHYQKAEIERVDQQSKQQLDQIQKLQTVTECQKDQIGRIDQLCEQYQSQIDKLTNRIADIETVRPALPIPTPEIKTSSPIVTVNTTTNDKTTLDVTPAWYKPIKPVSANNIRFPTNYNKNSPYDVRTYNCLSAYRSMIKNKEKIDFVEEPFSSAVDNTETLIVVLNELTYQFGARLTFTDAEFKYNDSDYRAACGIANLGSIHSFLDPEGNLQTAKFTLHLKLDYDEIRASNETTKNFVLAFINDISSIAECNKEFIRVFDITRAASVIVGFGIATPHIDETIEVAERLKEKLNENPIKERRGIFQHLLPELYNYKREPVLLVLQLQQSDFEPRYNRDYPDARESKRGGLPYYLPQGWYRHALKVIDKYPDDQVWLGMNNSPGEWAVAYHGTQSSAVRGIIDNGLLHSFFKRDAMRNEANQQNSSIPDVKGLYVATHCEGGASKYTTSFPVKDSTGNTKNYRVVFQCRIQPGKFTVHQRPGTEGMIWRVFDEKAIRPYGLLLKES